MSNELVKSERDGKLAIIVLDRPERRNALNEEMWSQLDAAVTAIEKALPRAVVITGAGGKAFSAGMDVNPDNPQVARLVQAVASGDRGPGLEMLTHLRGIVDRLVALPVPVIAAVNGLAYGGGAELAVRCDLRVMDPAAVICFSEVKLGLMPDLGGGPALTRLVGRGRAADLILTARKLGAEEALALGVVNRVSVSGGARAEALDLGRSIAANGPRAVRYALKVIRRSVDLPLGEALSLELQTAADLIASGEATVGIPAFMSRSVPDFPDIDD